MGCARACKWSRAQVWLLSDILSCPHMLIAHTKLILLSGEIIGLPSLSLPREQDLRYEFPPCFEIAWSFSIVKKTCRSIGAVLQTVLQLKACFWPAETMGDISKTLLGIWVPALRFHWFQRVGCCSVSLENQWVLLHCCLLLGGLR